MSLGALGSFSFANILGSIIFSGVGFVAFRYGRQMGNLRTMVIGGALLGYSYFMSSTFWTYAVGLGLTALLFADRL
ncbi:MAG: hypothetical protein KGL53_04495 [Elusimicrobia bacterium]|nr:hypothetical protein [Elusimicrobiota bacterium]